MIFATLGPSGSNHERVTREYLAFHGQDTARVVLVERFADALAMMRDRAANFTVQAAAHPEMTETIAKAHFRHGIRVVDTFIAPSYPLGILTRAGVETPRTLALNPATEDYADISKWQTIVPEVSTAAVAEGLLKGKYDSGLTRLSLAEEYPDQFRVDATLGTVDDPWIVFGKDRTCDGKILAWRNSPAGAMYRR